jgi:hypothetical protein
MQTHFGFVALALVIGLATPAFAEPKTNLTAVQSTIAGPGTTRIAVGGTERIFTHSGGASDVCVTVANTGKVPLDVTLTSTTSPTAAVSSGATTAVCSEDVTAIDLVCLQESACNAQWRVDEN